MPTENSKSRGWNHTPALPIKNAEILVWPPNPVAAAKWLFGTGFVMSPLLLYVFMGIATTYLFGPALASCMTFEPGWIALVYALNLGSTVLVAGSLHLYFYSFKRQGSERRIDSREHGKDDPRYFGRDQTWDNIFYTCVSGVTIWTLFQVLVMWAFANNFIVWTYWDTNPIWFVALFPLLVFWESFHFYVIHRLLHWPPLYKVAHALHHRNVSIGPWSGFSMHPIEHLLYFSTLAIHLFIASHPIHLFFHAYFTALAAITSHTGYTHLTLRGKDAVRLGDFFHQLHHRYFDCNYGTSTMPWDKWFGSFHDGTQESTERVRRYQATARGSRPAGSNSVTRSRS